jgi:hypothetical protein
VTVGDLEQLIADLPHRRVPAASPPRRTGPPRALFGVGLAALLALMVPSVIMVAMALMFAAGIAAVAALFALGFVFGPFILLGLVIAMGVRRRRAPSHWHPRWR